MALMTYSCHMDEWLFTPAGVDAYIRRNLEKVRALTGRPELPVEMLGELFEADRSRLLGPGRPTGEEVAAAAQAAREAGAVGISFFDWMRDAGPLEDA